MRKLIQASSSCSLVTFSHSSRIAVLLDYSYISLEKQSLIETLFYFFPCWRTTIPWSLSPREDRSCRTPRNECVFFFFHHVGRQARTQIVFCLVLFSTDIDDRWMRLRHAKPVDLLLRKRKQMFDARSWHDLLCSSGSNQCEHFGQDVSCND